MTTTTQNLSADHDEKTGATAGNHPSPSSEKPVRRDFYMTVVLGPNGSIVPEEQWKKVTGELTGRDMNKALKQNKMTMTRVFQSEDYDAARTNFRSGRRDGQIAARQALIDEAFSGAGQPHSKRVENALRTLLPLYKDATPAKIAQSFDRIIKAIVHGSGDLPQPSTGTDAPIDEPKDESKANLH
jgi:hypothetical protein